MQYAEFLKKHCNAVDGTFYDAINFIIIIIFIGTLGSSMPSPGADVDESAPVSNHNLRSHENFLQVRQETADPWDR